METPLLLLPVTYTFIALVAGATMVLTGWVGLLRSRLNLLRDGGSDPALYKRIRIHGNFVENAPVLALALGAGEAMGLAAGWLWLAILSFVLGRVLHVLLYDTRHRGLPMTLTQAPSVAIGLWVLARLWVV